MPLLYRSGPASRLFWSVMVLVLIALWGSVAYLHRDHEARELAAARRDVLNLSLAFAEHTQTSFQRVETLLLQLRKSWLADRRKFTDEVRLLQSSMSDLALQVAVIGADGRLDYSNLALASDRIDLSDREHFRVVRDRAAQGVDRLFVSRPVKGRVSGRWSIQFVRPILGPAGEFSGVLVVSVAPEYFARFYEAIDLDERSVVAMVRDSGEILTRAPGLDTSIGRRLSGAPYLGAEAPLRGTFRRAAQVDGNYRIYGFHRLPDYGVTLVVGAGEAEVLANSRQEAGYRLAVASVISAVLLLMMVVVARAQSAELASRKLLDRSEEQLRRVQEVMPAGLVLLDRKGDVVACNPAAERILGVGRDALLSRQLSVPEWNAVRPDGKPIPPAEFPGAVALREQRPVLDFEMGVGGSDAPSVWLNVSATPTGDPERPVVVVFSDITGRRLDQQRIAASERRFRTLFESLADPVFVVDAAGRFSMVHMPEGIAACADPAGWVGRRIGEVLPPAVVAAVAGAQASVSGACVIEAAMALGDAPARCYRVSVSPLLAGEDSPEGCVLVFHDVTAERAAAGELRIAATTFESQQGMMITDADGTILRVNRAFTELTGYAAEEVIGRSPSVLKSGRHGAEFYREMWAVLRKTGYWQGEVWNRRKGGEIFPEWLTISAVYDESRVSHYVSAFSDITERKLAEERIRHLAFYDPLTELPNRRLLADRLQQALLASVRSGRVGALMYLDLDRFKLLNDTRGHDAGDALLVGVAQRLRQAVRDLDTVARLGGDEFIVMLEDLGDDAAAATAIASGVAEKIRSAINAPFALSGGDYQVTPSIGVTLFHGVAADAQSLFKQADLALYEAKAAGRNCVRFFAGAIQS